MTAFEDEPKNPVWVTCSACSHRWIGLYLPMPISDAAKAMKRLTCPKCANTKILVLPERLRRRSLHDYALRRDPRAPG